MRECATEERITMFEEVCRKKKIKITPQRLEIFRELAKAEDHPDAETVYQRVRERMPTVSLDTVYRALWLFNDLGLINTFGVTRESTRFDANLSRHHHFVCSVCGFVRDFHGKDFDQLTLPEEFIAKFGQPVSTCVEVRGVCFRCSQKHLEGQAEEL